MITAKNIVDHEDENYREREIWIGGYEVSWDEYLQNSIKANGRKMQNYKSKMQEQLQHITRMHGAKNRFRKYDKCGKTD